MPIFARRRLQAMLHDLGPRMTRGQAADLLVRLEHRQTEQALSAEFELALSWAIGQVADLTIAPSLPAATPDARSDDLLSSGPALIEITAVSDDAFSGKKHMNRAANKIAQSAERIRRGSGKFLYFEFADRHYFEAGRYHRVRLISPKFELTPAVDDALRVWLTAPDWPNPTAIRLKNELIDVIVRWKDSVHPLFRVFSPMPPIAYDLEDNTLFNALQKKRRQLSGAPAGMLRCIFVGDAGCLMLREPQTYEPTRTTKSAGEIIQHFLQRSSIDLVCVFSPRRRPYRFDSRQERPYWGVEIYDRRQVWNENEHEKLKALAAALPAPRLEGYQARDRHRQGLFGPQARGWYSGSRITMRGPTSMSIRIHSRLLQDFLAGRIEREQFELRVFGSRLPNQFEYQLKRGLTIQGAGVEKAGLDEDGDIVVFELEMDPAAHPLKMPAAEV